MTDTTTPDTPEDLPGPDPQRGSIPAPALPVSLLHHLVEEAASSGGARAAITFAGQGRTSLDDLAALVRDHPDRRDLVERGTRILESFARSDAAGGHHRGGFDVATWADLPDLAPRPEHLAAAAVSYPLNLLTQAVVWDTLVADGLGDAFDAGAVVAVTGHSQGLLAVSMIAGDPGSPVSDERLERALRLAASMGVALSSTRRAPVSLDATTTPGAMVTPMAAVRGVRLDVLDQVVAEVNARFDTDDHVQVALHNGGGRFVVAGPPRSLVVLRASLGAGVDGFDPMRAWEPLPVEVAFHTAALGSAMERYLATTDVAPLVADIARCAVPVLSPVDGSDLRVSTDADGLERAVVASQFVDPIRWDTTVSGLVDLGARWVLDVGPGTDVARLTSSIVRGTGVRSLALASPEGRRLLFTPGASPLVADLDYATLAPTLVRVGSETRIDNRYSRSTGRPPFILAGMTPTTVDPAIVVAAANAGYTAELAGGGQVTPELFDLRIGQLVEGLEPGREVVFNALLLDPYLWALHLSGDRLVERARRSGAPLSGVTVSAGVPEVDEGVALLDRLAALGMRENAFKPGTAEQVRKVLAIADAARRHTVFLHLEGGRAGGHHSWEDLDDLLVATYDDIRLRPNVVLCVGGGVGTEERATALLTGRWAVEHGLGPRPVDAVLLGTVAMACAESTASPSVKQALVDAGPDSVINGRSHLGADIHQLDNRAARVSALLDRLAGDADRIAERRDEIVEALAGTSRPYFGDLDSLTYLGVLRRFTELCAIGDGRPDADGAWGDLTWRHCAFELYQRFAARLDDADHGLVVPTVSRIGDLDDPGAALDAFADRYVDADDLLLHPADGAFVLEVCGRPGKPLPFVPVIDRDIRRWYGTDSLWAAQDDRFDAEEVLVIPGPDAVAGITRPDEPVADLLTRFDFHLRAQLAQDGAPVAGRDRVLGRGLAPAVLADAVAGASAPLAAFCLVASVGTGGSSGGGSDEAGTGPVTDHDQPDLGGTQPNPLWQLVRPGDHVGVEDGDRPSWLVVVPDGGQVGEAVEVRYVAEPGGVPARAGEIELATTLVGADGTLRRTSRTFAVIADPAGWRFVELDRDVSAAIETRAALLDEDHPLSDDTWIDLGQPVERSWTLDPERARAYGIATGATHDGLAPDLVFTLGWPALAALVADGPLAIDFVHLLHRRHEVAPGAAWPPAPGETGWATAWLRELRTDRDSSTYDIQLVVSSERGTVAEVAMIATVALPPAAGDPQRWRRDLVDVDLAPDAVELEWLLDQAWVGAAARIPGAGEVVSVRVDAVTQVHDGRALHRAVGGVWVADELIAPVDTVHAGAAPDGEHPVRVAVDLLAGSGDLPALRRSGGLAVLRRSGGLAALRRSGGLAALRRSGEDPTHPVTGVVLARIGDEAPSEMDAFARIGGDTNPLHRSVLGARRAGLDRPIVHGMWTSARAQAAVVEVVADGDSNRVQEWKIDFLAPLAVGAPLDIEITRSGLRAGATVVAVVVTGPDGPVARATAVVGPPRTALVFPGQGVQRRGIGMEAYARSAAARQVWDLADAITRDRLGFSVLDVVRRNPTVLAVGAPAPSAVPGTGAGSVLRHPDGVINLTQITQVVLASLAAAQVAELREVGVLPPGDLDAAWPDVVVAGHSVGEFNALAALGVVPLDVVLELVFRRGEAMQAEVPRRDDGSSPYRLAVVDPSRSGLCHEGLEVVVAQAAERSGELVEIVNHNAEGRQYAVAATEAGLAALTGLLEEEADPGTSVLMAVAGIDVPFHSSVLSPAAERFRTAADELIGEVEGHRLAARYLPNVTAAPIDGVGRDDLVDLLARQLASPVRWIETQRQLFATVDRIIEIGPGTSPVLTNLARTSSAGSGAIGPALLHAELDLDVLRGTGDLPVDDLPVEHLPAVHDSGVGAAAEDRTTSADQAASPSGPAPASSAPPSPVVPGPAVEAGAGVDVAGEIVDVPLGSSDALLALLAFQAWVRPEQIDRSESLDRLFEGVSSRRNQVLVDLGKEFGLSSIDGAHEVPIDRLVAEIADRSPRYRYPGPYLREAVTGSLTKALAATGLSRAQAEQELATTYGLGPGLADRVLLRLALDGRDGPSARGGDLAGVTSVAQAVTVVGTSLGVDLQRRVSGGGSTVDAAAVDELRGEIADAVVGATESLAAALGRRLPEASPELRPADPDLARLAALDQALGAGRAEAIAPRFDPRRHVAFTSSWASSRWDLIRLYHDAAAERLSEEEIRTEARRLSRHAGDPAFDATVEWFCARAARSATSTSLASSSPTSSGGATGLSAFVAELRAGARPSAPPSHQGEAEPDLALVTGASPGSIAASVVGVLLAEGARVVVATSTEAPERRRFYRNLYRRHAAPGAELHVLPANLASFDDIDAVVAWLVAPTTAVDRHRPDPFAVTAVFPFAAVPTIGLLPDAGSDAEVAIRLQLLGIERLIGRLAQQAERSGHRGFRVVLPLSPNHGEFGGDLPYGETKAALESILARHRSEPGWARYVRPVAARIGWVSGTGVMAGNASVAPLVAERLGIHTYTAEEMGALVALLDEDADLTGGLGGLDGIHDQLGSLGAELAELADRERRLADLDDRAQARVGIDVAAGVPALPRPATRIGPVAHGPKVAWPELPDRVTPADLVVVVGTGELGPCGSATTRFELELGELSGDGVAELAWMCGLIRWDDARSDGAGTGWVDVATDEPVDEAELDDRYRDEVIERVGLRPMVADGVVDPAGTLVYTPESLDRPMSFVVSTEDEARTFVAAAPDRTTVRVQADGRLRVTLDAGAVIQVPRRSPLPRGVVGQLPTGFDLAAWGVPPEMIASVDRMALVDLVTTAEAFARAGLDPEELLAAVHPTLVANVQGAGQGGMASLRRMLVDNLLDGNRQPDRLQETLVNVMAAHTVQSLVGSYGPMVHPVAACATAAVSIEEAVDKIGSGRALVAVAGGFDDITPDGVIGFADMAATADTEDMAAMGLSPSEMSRSNDSRRKGFVESQGGGSMIVMRGDVALELGLPVDAVVAYAGSFGDGVNSSIPAPGMGVLGAARGGPDSPLARGLARLGLSADDIAVVSKHDTSTEINDPNEADLHHRIQDAIGRTPGNPLLVVSQKTVTGHAKGGAAAWQIGGLIQVMGTGRVPGNRNLDDADALLRSSSHLAVGDRTIDLAPSEPVRAALLTSLGFGHVSALVALAHPDAFLATVPVADRAVYLARAARRRGVGERDRIAVRHGRPVFHKRADRRIPGADPAERRDAEAALLLDPAARLDPTRPDRTRPDRTGTVPR